MLLNLAEPCTFELCEALLTFGEPVNVLGIVIAATFGVPIVVGLLPLETKLELNFEVLELPTALEEEPDFESIGTLPSLGLTIAPSWDKTLAAELTSFEELRTRTSLELAEVFTASAISSGRVASLDSDGISFDALDTPAWGYMSALVSTLVAALVAALTTVPDVTSSGDADLLNAAEGTFAELLAGTSLELMTFESCWDAAESGLLLAGFWATDVRGQSTASTRAV